MCTAFCDVSACVTIDCGHFCRTDDVIATYSYVIVAGQQGKKDKEDEDKEKTEPSSAAAAAETAEPPAPESPQPKTVSGMCA